MEELAPASLRDGTSEEELQPVFGKQGLLVLTSQDAFAFSYTSYVFARRGGARLTCLWSHPSLSSSCFCATSCGIQLA